MTEKDLLWHQIDAQRALEHLQSSRTGLNGVQARERLARHGPNEIQVSSAVSAWSILLEQFRNVLILILLAATAVSAALGHGLESIVIAVIVLFAVLLGFVQEYRAERALEALRAMAAPQASVLRDGAEIQVPAREVVPGDIVMLHSGDQVPADARIVECFNLQTDEAALTGESMPVSKNAEAIAPPASGDIVVADRTNMVHAGTNVTFGRGRAVVVATGMRSEFGKIAGMLREVESAPTPLQRNLDRVGSLLARGAIVIVALICIQGLMRGQPLIEMLIFGIALAVAVVPEALPAVVTISLALGVQRMVRRHALVRRLPAVEALGSTSVICSDKTGTLTRDEMTVRRIYCADQLYEVSGIGYTPAGRFHVNGCECHQLPPALTQTLLACVLSSDALLLTEEEEGSIRWKIQGDPTEGALIVAAAKAGIDMEELDHQQQRVNEIPFSSETRCMTTLCRCEDKFIACAKGAPEAILARCTQMLGPHGVVDLDANARERVLAAARSMAEEALRVLAVASRDGVGADGMEDPLVFLGLLGMSDPPREEARESIQTCIHAGIRPVMITGDHPLTARAIAAELGLLLDGRVVSGDEIEAMSDDELQRAVTEITVYARVSPAHKLRVVRAWQAGGHVVAMTGDGVNDAPALKQADIGVAMGITGTDVSREAAAMTLTDDNFASIVAAVEEGRGVFGNIKKYLMYLLSSNIGEIGVMGGAALLGLPLPLAAVQILYVNLATDGLPALALAVDPPAPDLMQRPPRERNEGIFTRPVVTLMLVGGIWSTLVNLGLFIWALASGQGLEKAMTMCFVSLVLIQFFKAYNFRSDRRSVLARPFANRWLNLAVIWELALLVAIVEVPVLHQLFRVCHLSLHEWLLVAGVAVTVMPPLEVTKWLIRRGRFAVRRT